MARSKKIPKYIYGIRLYICPSCGRKQRMVSDDKAGAAIECISCYARLKVVINYEVDNDLYDCHVAEVD